MSSRLIALDFAFADLRAAGEAAGGTVNDAFVAAQLGAFRRYHAELGSPIDLMPISPARGSICPSRSARCPAVPPWAR